MAQATYTVLVKVNGNTLEGRSVKVKWGTPTREPQMAAGVMGRHFTVKPENSQVTVTILPKVSGQIVRLTREDLLRLSSQIAAVPTRPPLDGADVWSLLQALGSVGTTGRRAEELLGQLGQTVHLPARQLEGLHQLGVRALSAERDVDGRRHPGQRRAELMGRVGDQSLLGQSGSVQLVGGRRDTITELGDLVLPGVRQRGDVEATLLYGPHVFGQR